MARKRSARVEESRDFDENPDPLQRPLDGSKPTKEFRAAYVGRAWIAFAVFVFLACIIAAVTVVLVPAAAAKSRGTETPILLPKYGSLVLTVPLFADPASNGAAYVRVGEAMALTKGRTEALIRPPDPKLPPSTAYVAALELLTVSAAGFFSLKNVYGTVSTQYGVRPFADVMADVEGYRDHWAGSVGGVYLDEVSASPAEDAYNTALFAAIAATGMKVMVGCATNPSTVVSQDPNVGRIVTFEGGEEAWAGFVPGSGQISSNDAGKWGAMVLGAASKAAIEPFLDRAISRNYGAVFISDLTVFTEALPSYFATEASIIAFN